MFYARGLQPSGYQPTLFDAMAIWFGIYDPPPVTVNQIKLNRR